MAASLFSRLNLTFYSPAIFVYLVEPWHQSRRGSPAGSDTLCFITHTPNKQHKLLKCQIISYYCKIEWRVELAHGIGNGSTMTHAPSSARLHKDVEDLLRMVPKAEVVANLDRDRRFDYRSKAIFRALRLCLNKLIFNGYGWLAVIFYVLCGVPALCAQSVKRLYNSWCNRNCNAI